MSASSLGDVRRLWCCATAALVLLAGCSVPIATRSLRTPGEVRTLDAASPYLKAHMRNGDVYVLSSWKLDEASDVVTGSGERRDANRNVVEQSDVLRLAVGSVALFETNVLHQSPRIQSIAIMTGVSAAVTVACLSMNKACFGSCPTFYASDGDREILQAEGFSSSILPSLEKRDIDALYRARSSDGHVELRMTNEALETHVVRYVHLLAVPRTSGSRIFVTEGGEFWRSGNLVAASRCHAPEGDCTAALAAFDAVERFTPADRHNLGRHETVDLTFDLPDGRRAGVVIAARQTLLSTFLLYQAYAFLGSTTGDRLTALENRGGEVERRAGGIARQLGGIEVLVPNGSGGWQTAGEYHETGPLATDMKVLPLPVNGDGRPSRIRLRMTRGLWRVDTVQLVTLDEQLEPVEILPAAARSGDSSLDPAALFAKPLVTLPGDSYTFRFDLPDGRDYELFLDTRGYYLEWMRQEWMREESWTHAAAMMMAPGLALRLLAPEFKRIEAQMEQSFWGSKYATH